MADTRLTIAGRIYSVNCQPGEETHLARLGAMLDVAARKAGGSGGLTETRALLFAGLLLADELADANDQLAAQMAEQAANAQPGKGQGDLLSHDDDGELAARAMERLATRLENIASALEKQSDRA